MSLGALATVLMFVALHGTAPQADEGAAAHIWQLLMAAQVPIVLFFAIKWHDKPAHQPVNDERAYEPQNVSQALRRAGRNPRLWRATLLRSFTGSSLPTKSQFNAEEVRHS
jgi:hypothetical protein